MIDQQIPHDDDNWLGLEKQVERLEWLRDAIDRREARNPAFDSWDARDLWEADLSLLIWALTVTAARTARALSVKIRALQAFVDYGVDGLARSLADDQIAIGAI